MNDDGKPMSPPVPPPPVPVPVILPPVPVPVILPPVPPPPVPVPVILPPVTPPPVPVPVILPPVPVPVIPPPVPVPHIPAAKSYAEEMNKPDDRSLINKAWDAVSGKNSYQARVTEAAQGAAHYLKLGGVEADTNKDGKFSQDEINQAIANLPKKSGPERGGRE